MDYTVNDVLVAGLTIEPLTCRHCNHTGEVTFNQQIGDAYCAMCGQWQLENDEELT